MFTDVEVHREFPVRVPGCDGVDQLLIVRADGLEAQDGRLCWKILLDLHRVKVLVEDWMTGADHSDWNDDCRGQRRVT